MRITSSECCLATLAAWALLAVGLVSAATPREVDVFVSGEDGYHTYRIPALVVTNEGTLLAFCEGRTHGRSDSGDIDLLLRRSNDGGLSWTPSQTVWDDGPHTCGNPCPVVDRTTGVIWLLMTWNAGDTPEDRINPGYGSDSRRVFITSSSDDGRGWATPKEITRDVKHPSWSWYATGPGAGIQLERGEHRGRLVIPCDHKTPTADGLWYDSHIIYSDDSGVTWSLGGTTRNAKVNECEVAELADGRLLLNMRNYDRTQTTRKVSHGSDGGLSWSEPKHDPALVEPICQASLRRYRWPEADVPGVLLFSNPASPNSRTAMTIRASYDDGLTWPVARLLHAGGSAYSCLDILQDGRIGCLYEKDNYARVTLAVFPFEWLTEE